MIIPLKHLRKSRFPLTLDFRKILCHKDISRGFSQFLIQYFSLHTPFPTPTNKHPQSKLKTRVWNIKVRTQFYEVMVLRTNRFYWCALTAYYLWNMSIFRRSPPFPPPHYKYPISNLPINFKWVLKKSQPAYKRKILNHAAISYLLHFWKGMVWD